jgi:PBSX family phage terminase large subunit
MIQNSDSERIFQKPGPKPGAKAVEQMTAKQRESLLMWIAQGLSERELIANAKAHKPSFSATPARIAYWRKQYGAQVLELRKQRDLDALTYGVALRANRLKSLMDLAQMLEDDLRLHDKLWIKRVKGIGSGRSFERVVEEEFNEAELRQLRGLYEDIAKEVGGRTFGKEDATSEGDAPGLFVLPADILAPSFLNVYRDIRDGKHTEYLFKGGRGSTKSTFVGLIIIYLLLRNPTMHALATRQVANTLRDSVYAQIRWGINELGLYEQFRCTTSPLEITYLPTGQKIYFRGADDPNKIKSIKPAFGYIGLLWFEELDQFHGQEAIRKIEQSVIRGGDVAFIFKSFNPPRTSGNWANKYSQIPKESQLIHESNYLEVPEEWLGQTFLEEALHLKEVNPDAYDHEYMGDVNGAGGQVFANVLVRAISDEEISQFDRIAQGIDWGYYPDPFAWTKSYFHAGSRTMYIFDEYKGLKLGNKAAYDILVKEKHYNPQELIIADSAEPKSIGDFKNYGATIRGAEKGPESVTYSMKWFQALTAIVIDPVRCPNTMEEFLDYELEQDKDGEFISSFPDKNNHFIDATRYAHNAFWRRRGQ